MVICSSKNGYNEDSRLVGWGKWPSRRKPDNSDGCPHLSGSCGPLPQRKRAFFCQSLGREESLLYYSANAVIGTITLRYVVEADSVMSEPSLEEILTSLSTADFLKLDIDIDQEELLGLEVEVHMTKIDEERFADLCIYNNYDRVRPELTCTMLTRPQDVVYNIIRIFPHALDDDSYGLYFQADYGQDTNVTYINTVDKDNPREEVVSAAQRDLMYQLKRYFSLDGVVLRQCALYIAVVGADEYETLRKERELVLD